MDSARPVVSSTGGYPRESTIPALGYKTNSPFPWCGCTGTSIKKGLLGVDSIHIIDGQQRLTTLQYVLASIRLALRATDLSSLEALISPCLKNSNEDTMRNKEVERFKLWPTFRDQTHFIQSFNVENIDDLRDGFSDSFTQHGTLRKHFNHPPSLEALCFLLKPL